MQPGVPLPGRHLLGALLHPAPSLGRARAIKKQLRLVQRTRVGLWGCSCCDLSWPEPCSDQTVLCPFSLPWLRIPIGGTLWSPPVGCVLHPVTGLCPWAELAGGCETGVWCGLAHSWQHLGQTQGWTYVFPVTSSSKHKGLMLPRPLACSAVVSGMASVALCFLSLVLCSL